MWSRTTQFGLSEGPGSRAYPDGSLYKGEWSKGLRHGYGVLFMKNGERYDGPWHRDRKHGEGIWSIPYSQSDIESAQVMDDEEKASWREISVRYMGEEVTAEKERAAKIRAAEAKGIADTLVGQMKRRTFRNLPPPTAEVNGASVVVRGAGSGTVETGGVDANGQRLSDEAMEEIAAAYGAQLFDADEEGTFPYEGRVLEDVAQVLALSKDNYEGAGLFEWRQSGQWDYAADQRVASLGQLKSKVATIEFKRKFPITSKDPVLFVSEYATSVASYLPFLPDGVDPEDVIVRFIVERLIQENPGNAGVDGLKRAEKAVKALLPAADTAFAAVTALERKLVPLQDARQEAENRANTSLTRLKAIEAEQAALNKELDDYWEKDPKHARRTYLEAVERLKNCTRADWYNMRTLQYPFQARIVQSLMSFFSIMVGCKDDWQTQLLYWSNSDANIKVGHVTLLCPAVLHVSPSTNLLSRVVCRGAMLTRLVCERR